MGAIEKAAAEAAKYFRRECELIAEFDDTVTEISKEQSVLGAAMAENKGGADTHRIVELRNKLAVIESAAEACRLARAAALRTKAAARLTELKDRAAAVRSESKKLDADLAKLLDQVSELQGKPFTMAIFGRGIPGELTPFAEQPRSELLASELGNLERKIVEQENFVVPRDGIIDPTDVEEDAPRAAPLPEHRALSDQLLDHLAAFEGITPPVAAVLGWLESVESEVRRLGGGGAFTRRGRRVYLAWVNGIIDEAKSHQFIPELAAAAGSVTYQTLRSSEVKSAGGLALERL